MSCCLTISDTSVNITSEFPIYDVFSNGIKLLGADNSVFTGISYSKERFSELLSGSGIFLNSKQRRLSYSDGVLVIRSRFWRETIRVKNVVSCRRLAYTLLIETTKFRSIQLVFETLSHASTVERVLSDLADGVYKQI